jgi:peptidyl-prolyl cis-trans isomerase C
MRYILIFLLLLGITSCGQKEERIASIDGKAVTRETFEAYLKFKRLNPKDDKQRIAFLDQYLQRAALVAAIEKSGNLDNAMVDAELEEFRKQMLISRYFEKYLNEAVAEDAMRNYYNTHAADYQETRIHVAHILIRTNPKMSETERKAKLTAAQEAYSKVRSGEDFAVIAGQYSEDSVSARKGGDLGWIRKGGIDANFSKIAFELEESAVSEPFETPFGYHVVKVIEKPRTIKKSFEAVVGDIRHRLRGEAKKAELDRLLDAVKVEKR